MSQAKQGDTVKVHYTGKLEDGSVFDSSHEREPLEFNLGEGQVISGFEQAVEGMAPGESKAVEVAPEEGYGPRRDDMVLEVGREQLPEDLEPFVGQQLKLSQPDGEDVIVNVTEVDDEQVKLDANHPLAGEALHFDIELVDIV